MKNTLVLGSGLKRFSEAIRLDINPRVNPDVIWDLNNYPWPFEDNRFKFIIAEHILEHIWTQGDVEGYFKLFREIWRICKNGAEVNIELPYGLHSIAFSDPGHKSFWVSDLFAFVSKKEYERHRKKKSMMTQYDIDFDFDIKSAKLFYVSERKDEGPGILSMVLRAVK